MIAPWLEAAWTRWNARRASGRLPHAVLIGGPAGLGKRAFAQALVDGLLCPTPDADGRACGRCRDCVWLAAGTHPDRIHVSFALRDDGTPRREIVIEQIRDLCARLAMTSQRGGLQVAWVEPAEAMNRAAANALLKTLEEPAADTVVVLVADVPGRLPATIRSRCQRIDVRYPARAAGCAWLVDGGVPGDAAEAALAMAGGNPGLARVFAEAGHRRLQAETLGGLEKIAERRASTAATAQAWAGDRPAERMRVASLALAALAWARRGVAPGAPLGRLPRLTATVDFHKLAACWRRANLVRDQLETPLRTDLLLIEWLDAWRDLAVTGERG